MLCVPVWLNDILVCFRAPRALHVIILNYLYGWTLVRVGCTLPSGNGAWDIPSSRGMVHGTVILPLPALAYRAAARTARACTAHCIAHCG